MAYDALLWLSFGGPEGPDEVMPFLENVTRGRGVPRERLEEVAEHYYHFDGVSPINRLNREAIAALESRLAADGVELPVYFGNRNWQPYVEDTVRRMADDGVRSALVLATSAYGGYSASTQYDEDILRAREAVGEKAPELVKLRQFGDHPLFVEAVADGIRTAWQGMPPRTRVVFTAHSIPVSADEKQWPGDDAPHRYTRQVAEASRLVAAELGVDDYDVVWQSRSGPPSVPWLEPDIVDHLDTVAESGARGVVVSPIGFIAPHLEVVWDLDNEAAERAAELGLTFARAATAGEDPRFARLVAELIAEHADGDAALAPRRLSDIPAEPISINGTPR